MTDWDDIDEAAYLRDLLEVAIMSGDYTALQERLKLITNSR